MAEINTNPSSSYDDNPNPNSIAFLAGMTGGLIMILSMAIARAFGLSTLNVELIFGSLLTRDTGPGTWVLGLFTHMLFSGVVAILYGVVFRALGRSSTFMGILLGAIQFAAVGVAMGVFSGQHPMIPTQIADPGFFALNLGGNSFGSYFVCHLIFGALVGNLYESSTRALAETPSIDDKTGPLIRAEESAETKEAARESKETKKAA
ncbi:hypothetical protein WDW86_05465 [Bdellovibrionota bacterium FG-2]